VSVKIGLSGASIVAKEGRNAFLAYIDEAEAQGWDSIWFSDRIVGPTWRVDPLVGMAMISGRVSSLKFGTGVLLMSVRSPVTVARELATLDYLSNGRLVVGVGVGQEALTEYDAMGVRKQDRGRRLDEAIHVMRELWTKDSVTYQSEFLKLENASIGIHPYQQNIPIWVGSRSEAGLKRTGRMADGWLPTQLTPEEIKVGISKINRYAFEAGRSIADDHFGLQVSCYITKTNDIPNEIKENYLLRRRSDVSLEELNLLGSPAQIMDRIKKYIEAGATKFVLNPACGFSEMKEQMALLSEYIVQPFHQKLV
tara:strand:- start:2760 stop:3689 length:930 start_codon:yes stop_codon:yes gene_type:complete